MKLEDLNRCCPPVIPDRKPPEDPFKHIKEARATSPKKEESEAGDLIQSLDKFHLVLKIKQDSGQPVAQPQSPDQAQFNNAEFLDQTSSYASMK